jgi:alkylation response protein AidB-like acyl-CoA dehydrogenase
MRDSAVVQSAIGIADAKLNAARTWLIDVLRRTQEAVKLAGELTLEQRIAIRQASTFAIHQAKEVVDVAYHAAGSSAIFDNNPFERRFRDINTVTQQVQGRRSHFETVGHYLLGGKPNLRLL